MKTCPICHAKAFDDAETCYGCLHRFGESAAVGDAPCAVSGDAAPAPCDEVTDADADPDAAVAVTADAADAVSAIAAAPAPESAPPAFSIRFTPLVEKAGGVTWRCAVEMA